MDCYIEQRDLDGLREYFHTKIIPTGKQFSSDNTSFGQLANIHILELKCLLYQKFMFASSLHLQMDIDIPGLLPSAGYMDPVDLCKLMEIFLDTAIESAAKSEAKHLSCGLIKKHDSILIRLTNSCTINGVSLEKLPQNGSEIKSSDHDIGHTNAKEIIKKYPDIVYHTECQDGHFTRELYIGGVL